MFSLFCRNNFIIEVLFLVLIICLLFFWFIDKKVKSSLFVINIFLVLCLTLMAYIIMLYFHMDATYLYNYKWLDNFYYCTNTFQVIVKFFLIFFTACVLILNYSHLKYDKLPKFEFIILVILALFGMCVFVASADLLSFYLAFELQSFALYILVSIKRYDLYSIEAGFKYFIMGSFASILLLFGASIIYASFGTINFEFIVTLSNSTIGYKRIYGAFIGLIFILVCLFFKLPAAPFHTWAPDVYQGASTGVVAFLVVVSKFAVVSFLIRLLYYVFMSYSLHWYYLIGVVAILSMIVGAIGAATQLNIKRFFAYSTVNHVGFILLGVSSATILDLNITMFYLITYTVLSLNFFTILMIARHYLENTELLNLGDLIRLCQINPILGVLMCFTLFSFAGIPPLLGFFAKFFVLNLAMENDLLLFSTIGFTVSIISAFYYIRIIALIFFQVLEEKALYVHKPLPDYLIIIACVSLAINVLIIVCPQIFIIF